MDPVHGIYRIMLLDVANYIEDDDLKRMKFRCDSFVKKAESQRITLATEFFTALEQRERLGPRKIELLKELLKTCCQGRLEALRVLEKYERELGLPVAPQVNQHNGYPGAGAQVPPPQVVYVYQDNIQPGRQQPPQRENKGFKYDGPDLSREIRFLTQSLGRDWRFYVRALGVREEDIENINCEYHSVREKIYQCILQWQLQEQQGASKYRLIDALRDSSVQRNDLASTLEEGSYT